MNNSIQTIQELKRKIALRFPRVKYLGDDESYKLRMSKLAEDLLEQLQTLERETRKQTLEKMRAFVDTDAVMEVNATPEIGERMDIEKLNYANDKLNKLTICILQYVDAQLKERDELSQKKESK